MLSRHALITGLDTSLALRDPLMVTLRWISFLERCDFPFIYRFVVRIKMDFSIKFIIPLFVYSNLAKIKSSRQF